MDVLMDFLSLIAKLSAGYALFMAICALLPQKEYPKTAPKTRFALLIPARNEEKVIGNIIDSLYGQNYPLELFDIYVIPNNCTDDTAGAARRAGAFTLSFSGEVRCKGDVLHQTFSQLMGRYDAYCVFDADNLVHPDFLARMNDAYRAGAEIAKGKQLALNPYDSWVTGGYDLHLQYFNLFFNRPRGALGLSGKVIGTGFMISDRLLERLEGWNTVTMVEDLELAGQCALAGVQVHYVSQAIHYDEQPRDFRTSLRQRRRWSGGTLDVCNRYFRKAFTFHNEELVYSPEQRERRPILRLDFGIFISTIYVQLLALLPVLWALVGMSFLQVLTTLGAALVSFWLGGTALALFIALASRRDVKKMWKGIVLYPLFSASWYPLHILSVVKKPTVWSPIRHGEAKEPTGELSRIG